MTGSSPEPPEPSPPEPSPPEPSPPEPSPPEPIDAEIVAPATPQPPAPDYDERGIPSLDYVRDRIEGRYATALGGTELAEGTPQAHTLEEQQAQREKAAAAKLDEIRRKLRNEPS